ncbi:hypothetical protein BV898_11478 [Hypsibius exemplaris]|uniref:Uncharacterized protein n=1 Tax=Hypsibius exemplaris TaxID=2072580 RepID=A0A1W0WGM9_HYPEX|nr:hypothetical protein BV898_11478 [Hypsibius exemplaris]
MNSAKNQATEDEHFWYPPAVINCLPSKLMDSRNGTVERCCDLAAGSSTISHSLPEPNESTVRLMSDTEHTSLIPATRAGMTLSQPLMSGSCGQQRDSPVDRPLKHAPLFELPSTMLGNERPSERQAVAISTNPEGTAVATHLAGASSAGADSIKLGYNQELTEITMSPPAAAAASIQPRRLQRLWIYSNINLRSIPAAVIKTVRPSGPATSRGLGPPHFVIFQWNGNPCGGCALRPLVAWARQAALIGAPHLDLTCLVRPECGFKTISNRMTSWRNYVEPSCADDESVAIPDCGIVRSDDVFALHGYSAPKLLPGIK